jgi:Tfp pilus assembly protein PilP
MMRLLKLLSILLLVCAELWTSRALLAQESGRTPSEKTKDAVDKFNNAPATIGKSLQGLRDAAKNKLQETLGAKAKSDVKGERVDLELPQKAPQAAPPAPVVRDGMRDPFRPMTLRTKVTSRARDNLSPLERLDLAQLKLVGIIWDIKEPRAMVEDSAGLGYVVKVGTPIGSNDGKVKAIHRNQIVVEEFADDIYGIRKKHDVSMGLAAE